MRIRRFDDDVDPIANPTELRDVSPAMNSVVLASRRIFDAALNDTTGTTRAQRRASVVAAVEVFVARNYRLMPVAGGKVAR